MNGFRGVVGDDNWCVKSTVDPVRNGLSDSALYELYLRDRRV
ncbi:hypothetical protein ACBR55_12415 [Salinicoccus roseus]